MVVKGVLYYQDKPQLQLDIDTNKERYDCVKLNSAPVLPYEFAVQGINKDSFMLFIEERVMPETRQSMRSVLEWADLPFYDVELIATRNHFSSCNDKFWIRLEGEGTSWEQVQKL